MKKSLAATKAKTDFRLWKLFYLSHHFTKGSGQFQQELDALLQQAKAGERMAFIWPRGHGKTTNLAAFLAYVVCESRAKNIVYIGATHRKATQFVNDVRGELRTNERIRQFYGDVIDPRKDTESEFITRSGAKVQAMGAMGKIRGTKHRQYRPDLIILDDLENDENVQSGDQREKMVDWVRRGVLPALDMDGGMVFALGTILHMFGLMRRFADAGEFPGWTVRSHAAIEDGAPLWPERYDLATLDAKRLEIGHHAFAAEWMNNPVDGSLATFRPDWLKYYDAPPDDLKVHMSIDPALSEKASADYFAMVTVGQCAKTKNLYVLDVYRERGSTEAHTSAYLDRLARFRPAKVVIETVAFQQVLKEVFDRKAKERGIYAPTQGVKPHRDKVMRITKLQAPFERGEILVKRDMSTLIEEYTLYPSVAHDDQLDALEMVVDSFRQSFYVEVV